MVSLPSYVVFSSLSLLLAGCLIDSDDRCGTNQELDQRAVCVCSPGTAPTSDGHNCEPCGENEVVAAGSCECEDLFIRDASSGACVPAPIGLGAECSNDVPCQDQEFAQCQNSSQTSYCTSTGCESSEDCDGGYACMGTGPEAYCQRPPLGQGQSCSFDADCEGLEATYCENSLSNQCLVRDCEVGDCFEGWDCCDLRPLGFDSTLCVPEGQCPV